MFLLCQFARTPNKHRHSNRDVNTTWIISQSPMQVLRDSEIVAEFCFSLSFVLTDDESILGSNEKVVWVLFVIHTQTISFLVTQKETWLRPGSRQTTVQRFKMLCLLSVLLSVLLLLLHLLCTEDLGSEKELSAWMYMAVGKGAWTSLKKSLAKAGSPFQAFFPGIVLCAGGP